jgi:hypothetical protein
MAFCNQNILKFPFTKLCLGIGPLCIDFLNLYYNDYDFLYIPINLLMNELITITYKLWT